MVRLYHKQPLLKLVTIETISCSPGLDSLMEIIHQGKNLIGEMSFIKDNYLVNVQLANNSQNIVVNGNR